MSAILLATTLSLSTVAGCQSQKQKNCKSQHTPNLFAINHFRCVPFVVDLLVYLSLTRSLTHCAVVILIAKA